MVDHIPAKTMWWQVRELIDIQNPYVSTRSRKVQEVCFNRVDNLILIASEASEYQINACPPRQQNKPFVSVRSKLSHTLCAIESPLSIV